MILTGMDADLNGGIVTVDFETNIILRMSRVPVIETDSLEKSRRVNSIRLHEIMQDIRALGCTRIILERALLMPSKAGKYSSGVDTIHQTFGALRACAEINYPGMVIFVWPVSWKTKMKLTGDKKLSLERAATLHPAHAKVFSLKKNDGLAEGLLLAHWGYLHLSALNQLTN